MHSFTEKFIDAFKARTNLYDKISRGNEIKSDRSRVNILFTKGIANYSMTFVSNENVDKFFFVLKKQYDSNHFLSRTTIILELYEHCHSATEDELVSELLSSIEHQMTYHEELHNRFMSIHKRLESK
jgi:hypothetical protein